jgi:hypothetical protein
MSEAANRDDDAINLDFGGNLDAVLRSSFELGTKIDTQQVDVALPEVRERQYLTREKQKMLLNSDLVILRGREHAPRLSARHNSQVISLAYVAALELLSGNTTALDRCIAVAEMEDPHIAALLKGAYARYKEQPGYLLQLLVQIANEHGYFLMKYSHEYQGDRLEASDFLITEVSPPAQGSKPTNLVADCQTRIPAPDAQTPVLELPSRAGDRDYGADLIRQIAREPYRFALVEDITCQREYDLSGYAGLARNHNFHHIRTVINPLRPPERRITHSGAMIACAKGIRRPDGSEVRLQKMSRPPLLNHRSVMAHIKSRYAAALAYSLEDREVPVTIGDQEYVIITDWLGYMQALGE